MKSGSGKGVRVNRGIGRRTVLPTVLGTVLVLATGCAQSAPSTAARITSTATTLSEITSASAQGSAPVFSSEVPAPPAAEASTAAALPDCTAQALPTREPGILTVATTAPLEAPWFVGDAPADSDGYEAQIVRQVAGTLGFVPQQQKWVTVAQPTALTATDPGFDLFVDQVTDGLAAGTQVDLSSGYYAITDALLMPSQAVAALGGGQPDYPALTVGITGADTGQTALQEKGVRDPQRFPSVDSVLAALAKGQIEAAVLPTPDALRAAAADRTVTVVGQLPTGRWQPDQFHLALAADSPLTPCVSAAVDRMRIEGTLDQLTEQWINPLAPELD